MVISYILTAVCTLLLGLGVAYFISRIYPKPEVGRNYEEIIDRRGRILVSVFLVVFISPLVILPGFVDFPRWFSYDPRFATFEGGDVTYLDNGWVCTACYQDGELVRILEEPVSFYGNNSMTLARTDGRVWKLEFDGSFHIFSAGRFYRTPWRRKDLGVPAVREVGNDIRQQLYLFHADHASDIARVFVETFEKEAGEEQERLQRAGDAAADYIESHIDNVFSPEGVDVDIYLNWLREL